jgi:hypothetical protein
MSVRLLIEQPLELKFQFFGSVITLMFDIDDGSSRYRNTHSRDPNLKPLALLDTVSEPPQFFDKLFHRIVLLNVAFTFFLLCCRSQSPLFMILYFQAPPHRAHKGVFQPKIATGKEHENIHEQEHKLKFHYFSFFYSDRR